MGSTQLTANGLNTIGTKVTLNRVMVHLGFQLHRSFCRLSFPLQASLLCKGKIVILPHYPPQALSLVSAYFLWPPLFQWGYCLHHSAWAAASLPPELAPPRSLQTGCTAVPKRVIPVSCSPCAPSLPHSTWGQLLQLQRFYRRVHRPHGRSWETCQIPHAPPPPQAVTPVSRFPPCCNYFCSVQRFITCSCHNLFTRHKSHENKVDEVCVWAVFPGIDLPYLSAHLHPGLPHSLQ